MSLLEALLLGIVQGATEFLPVSSSGHLVLGQALLGIEVPGVLFEATVHLATLLSVCIVYRRELADLLLGSFRGEAESLRYLGALGVGTVPAVAVGLGLREPVSALFERPAVVGVALLVTGAFLWTTRWTVSRAEDDDVGWGSAVLVGIAQAGALVPGISRSGATVSAALGLGVRAERAAEYSFLLSVPAIAGAAVLEAPALWNGEAGVGAAPLAVGFVAASLTGVAAITGFLALLRREAFHRFAIYCWAVGGLFLVHLGTAGG